ncbi:MAG: hypothetical protein COA69_02830 [Robiginitomaculum sp.]|nr:MAG: hypothetical protein COA69_02830 [Robiginitomaculum sp.]
MISLFKTKPTFSVVIIAYNMAREIPRTVQSFLPPYQTGIQSHDIEIIVMENGSNSPVDPEIVAAWPSNVRYIRVQDPHPSPAQALNAGIKLAKADWVCPVIDGARLISPGIFKAAKDLINTHPNPLIATIGRHLGHKVQQFSVQDGYNQTVEDALLDTINWPNEPYRLFDISCVGGSAQGAWLMPIAESNVLILKKSLYDNLGGYDEAFDIPGGGLINLDFFKRAIEHEESQYFLLIGEASFHQYHGGVTTSRPVSDPSIEDETFTTWELYAQQYERIRGVPYALSTLAPILYGTVTPRVQTEALKAAKYIESIKSKS